jgi:hypothetical protein
VCYIYTALKDTIKSNDLVQSVHTIHGKRIHFTYCKAIVDQKLIHHELLHRLQISETEINHLLTVKSLIPLENVSLSSNANEVSQSLVKGFIYVQLEPDLNEGLLIPIADLKRGYRSNNEADNEYSVIGPKVGFVEDIDTNLNLIRKELISENLRFEECIVGSLSALPSFATPIFKMANTIRFLRFPLIILAAAWGGLGIMIGLVILLGHLLGLKSFFGYSLSSSFVPISFP